MSAEEVRKTVVSDMLQKAIDLSADSPVELITGDQYQLQVDRRDGRTAVGLTVLRPIVLDDGTATNLVVPVASFPSFTDLFTEVVADWITYSGVTSPG